MNEQNNRTITAYQESYKATEQGNPLPDLELLSAENLSPETKEIVVKCNEIIEASKKGNQAASS